MSTNLFLIPFIDLLGFKHLKVTKLISPNSVINAFQSSSGDVRLPSLLATDASRKLQLDAICISLTSTKGALSVNVMTQKHRIKRRGSFAIYAFQHAAICVPSTYSDLLR